MSDRIKKIKIKQTDGTFSDYIPIGANAKDIDLQYNDSNVENTLKKKPYYYDNVATMKLDDTLREGDMAITLGYYEANDGGGAEYKIISGDYQDDGGSIHALNNGLYSSIIVSNNEISYEQFGAHGDGVVNDFQSLKNTHVFANKSEKRYKVVGKEGRVYYIPDRDSTIPVKTNVDLKNATVYTDDSVVAYEHRGISLYTIQSENGFQDITGTVSKINRFQKNIPELSGHGMIFVDVVNSNKKDFIRKGLNQDSGSNRTDCFRVDNNGTVLDDIIWDFDEITKLQYRILDSTPIEFKNFNIITKINTIDSYNYYNTDEIEIRRDFTAITNGKHTIEGEEIQNSSPYRGFIYQNQVVGTILKNIFIQGRKGFKDSASGATKGTYELQENKSINSTFINIQQLNSIVDKDLWGCHASNYSKNESFENCVINRIDAHKGFWNLTVVDSIIGTRGLSLIGGGIGIFKNVQVKNNHSFITLREDYGSTWEGEFHIQDCSLEDDVSSEYTLGIVRGYNSYDWDFGYICYLPDVYVENFKFYSADNNAAGIIVTKDNNIANLDYDLDYDSNVENNSIYPQIGPSVIKGKNIEIESNDENHWVKPWEIGDISYAYCKSKGSVGLPSGNNNGCSYINNMVVELDNLTTRPFDSHDWYGSYSDISNGYINSDLDYTSTYRAIPYYIIKNYNKIELGLSCRPQLIDIYNSQIYKIFGTSKLPYVRIHDSTIHYRYHDNSNINSNRVFSTYDNAYELDNVFLIKDEEQSSVEDIIVNEKPFASITFTNHFLKLSGIYKNISFDSELLQGYENSKIFSDIKTYVGGVNPYEIAYSNLEKKTFPQSKGSGSSRPVDDGTSTGYIPYLSKYFDTTLNKIIYWDGNKWIDNSGAEV